VEDSTAALIGTRVNDAARKNLREGFDQAREWIMSNIAWLAPLIITLVLFGLVIWVRGAVAEQPWSIHVPALCSRSTLPRCESLAKFSRQANSLFLFRLALALGWIGHGVLAGAGMIFMIVRMIMLNAPLSGRIGCLGFFLGLIVISVAFW